MGETAAWDARLELTADGKGLVANAGVVLLRKTADAVGLTARLAEVFGPGRVERICRGAVLVGAASPTLYGRWGRGRRTTSSCEPVGVVTGHAAWLSPGSTPPRTDSAILEVPALEPGN